VDAVRTWFVSVLVKVTAALATTLPDFSSTVPAIDPVAVCAMSLEQESDTRK
jgi:hypothetical protein